MNTPVADRKEAPSATRGVAHRTRGTSHGPIARLMSPSDLGQLVKPFVFLDYFDMDSSLIENFPSHPHSGIATLTYMIDGGMCYEDSTGAGGTLPAGGVEWMMAGGGVWHTGHPIGKQRVRGFQLWMAMPPTLELAPAASSYLEPKDVPQAGPVSVLAGEYGRLRSNIPASLPLSFLAVRLKAGEAWQYQPEPGHEVAWLAMAQGELSMPTVTSVGEMVVFHRGLRPIEFLARTDAIFVLGSAVPHPHELVTGYYSVHTSEDRLERGERGIRDLAQQLRAQGKLPQRS